MKQKANKIKGKIAEGKTKAIYETDDPNIVHIVNKDALTKGDGKVKIELPGKGAWATTTTCNVFELLKKHGIPVAYIARIDERTFSSYMADMLKIEVIVRNVKYGSRLKRYPADRKGEVCEKPIIELFLKDDENNDPLIVYDVESDIWRLYDAKKPISEGYLSSVDTIVTAGGIVITKKIIDQILDLARRVNSVLKAEWEKQNVLLVDFKFEVGFAVIGGKVTLVVADVIDNDSWRIWMFGEETLMMDKEIFRLINEVSEADREKLKENYEAVANMTEIFLK